MNIELVSKNTLIQAFEAIKDTYWDTEDVVDEAVKNNLKRVIKIVESADVLAKIIEEENNKVNYDWIPASERTPKEDKKQYIVSVYSKKTNRFVMVTHALFFEDKWVLSKIYKKVKKDLVVAYWMPFPEPPNGGKANGQ